ncbi:MAG: hypothetical protein IMZ44_05610 [Planctomycetes bacterium]|nr:hypothetical protein [Planctomycetota bacterium]
MPHLNKSGGTRALYRAMGSLAFIAAARAAWLITPDPEDSARRLMLPAKLNLAEWPTGLAYRVGQVVLDEIGPVARIEWEHDPVSMTADEALGYGQTNTRQGDEARAAAVEWLQNELADGEVAASDVQSHAVCKNISARCLAHAKRTLRVRITKAGFAAGWRWALPENNNGNRERGTGNGKQA